MKQIRLTAAILCGAMLFSVLASCAERPAETPESAVEFLPEETESILPPETESEPESEPESEQEPILPPEPEETTPEFTNPLTGEECDEALSRRRPYAVIIGNTAKASPQEGLAAADVLIEWMVTITITRFCALYQGLDGTEPAIGGTRSVRVNIADAVSGMDAILISAGGPKVAYDRVSELGLTYINLLSKGASCTYRDEVRRKTMAYEHSLMLKPDTLESKLQNLVTRTEHEEGYESFLKFTNDGTPESGEKSEKVKIKFGVGSKTTTLSYDAEKGTYSGLNGEKRLMDAATEEDLSFRNLVILLIDTKDKGDGSTHVVTKVPGSGEGYFVCGGKYIPIDWEKKSDASPFTFSEKDGTPLEIGVGKTYMAFAPTGSKIDFE
ncbi:MAG: DUF3048 domain-containing protein [Clostridia bacterium]|nr:DUF3048 domain-containing protein [Clostridia bacterium]